MFADKRLLGIIPARGGSRGVPRKNIRMLGGKPLIAWTIEAARHSRYLDRLVLSSEDPEIISVALRWGCEVPFVRPAELAQDETPGMEVILHAITELEQYDYVVVLQPTSPFRTATDLDGAIECCLEAEAEACVSVCEADKSPYWMYHIDENARLEPILPLQNATNTNRQALPAAYALNGAIYIARSIWLQTTRTFIGSETIAYPMPKERSVDIDTELDFSLCEALMKESHRASR